MWRVLSAEIRYNWLGFTAAVVLLPLVVALQGRYETGYMVLLAYFVMLLSVNGWTVRYVREKRDYCYAQLPLSARTVAAARILMVLLCCTVLTAVFIALQVAFAPSVHANVRVPILLWGLLVIAYSLAFIFRDRFIGTRALVGGKIVLVIALGATLVLNILTMLSFNRAQAEGGRMPAMVRLFDFVERHNPTTSNLNTAIWIAVSLALAYLTVETYVRRRSHV